MSVVQPLSTASLYRHTDPNQLPFETTGEFTENVDIIGQPRATAAIRFGMGIESKGYNMYAMGPAGIGKRSLVQGFFRRRASDEPLPSDWCYLYNFEIAHKPIALQLPAGKGSELQRDMEQLVNELRTTLSASFESDEYRSQRHVIGQELQERQEKALEGLQQKAQEQGVALVRTPNGLILAPVRNGEMLSPEEFQNLPEEERKQMEATMEGLQEELRTILAEVPRLQQEAQGRIKELNQQVTNYAVGGKIDELQEKYTPYPVIVKYLDAVEQDVVENAGSFLNVEEPAGASEQEGILAMLTSRARADQTSALQRYKVNLLVDHRDSSGAPVVYEDNPTVDNLIGRVEHLAQMGALVTDFTLIKPGALHRANGGYLILDARKVLTQPYAWDALKRALQSNQIRIESIGQMLSLISTISLEPEPIPLNVKIALLGDREIYYMLEQLDPDFGELFKVQADFDELMDRSQDNQIQYARWIASLVQENKLKPFDRGAVARMIEHGARLVEDAEKLSTQVRDISNLLHEANYWSSENDNGVVTAADVQQAIDAQIYRADRVRERMQETILRGTFLVDTDGERVGQINGLSVIQLGGFSFGRPSRITAKVRMGKGEVTDIEREVDLSGPIHSKGVLILSGFLGSRFGRERPLTLSASLVFEQSYGGVDGDSASTAELYALLSAISNTPICQWFAVTGSINQNGEVQAIGGVNEKIEGFFDICRQRGLTGKQGVLIPSSNVKHLMLRSDVIQAVEEGMFQIYPVEHVDQGIELLTGIPAGEMDADGNYPSESINGRVAAHLAVLAEKARELNRPAKEQE